MGKKTDDKKTRKALARVRRTLRKKETLEGDAALSDWEDEFIDSLETRLEKFGSAFADPEKGAVDEALSYRQAVKLREVEKKAKGKGRKALKRSSFKSKKAGFRKPLYPRDEAPDEMPKEAHPPIPSVPSRPAGPPKLTVISGGRKKD
jgi:hypothetical protein